MLRRQMKMSTRKPLIVMSPKSLLRHKLAVSTLDELANGQFQHLIPDAAATPKKVKRVVLCSGKVYYDLLEDARKREQDDVAIVGFLEDGVGCGYSAATLPFSGLTSASAISCCCSATWSL